MTKLTSLIPFTPEPDFEISFHWAWHCGKAKAIFELRGPLAELDLQKNVSNKRQDELWKHTCFEFFLKADGQNSYYEANIATSGGWNFYHMEDYRKNLKEVQDCAAPHVKIESAEQFLRLSLNWDLQFLQPTFSRARHILLNPAVILQRSNGEFSYWAIRHSQVQPDFHHAQQFQMTFQAEEV